MSCKTNVYVVRGNWRLASRNIVASFGESGEASLGGRERRGRRVRKVVWRVLGGLLLALAAVLLVAVLAGYLYVGRVVTGSMQREIPQGSLLVARAVPSEQLRVGDAVVMHTGRSYLVHRIVELPGDGTVITQGTENDAPDRPIALSAVVGRVVWHSYAAGLFVGWLRANMLWLALIAVGAVVLVVAVRRLRAKT